MISNTRPTRAEVADVSGAVRDGYDAVMLSGETAVGTHPPLVVQRMASICETAEVEVQMPNYFADTNPERAAVTAAAAALAKRIDADGIIAITFTGYSARLMGACRPSCHIIAVTPTEDAARRLRVIRGVYPVVDPRDSDLTQAMSGGIRAARTAGLVHSGETLVVCASRLSPRSDADTLFLHYER
jgi:pyruvate kinase